MLPENKIKNKNVDPLEATRDLRRQLKVKTREHSFQQLVARLRELRHEAQTSRGIVRVVWALGKVSAKGADVSSILLHVANIAPGKLSSFSSQEICSMLWGLAKLSEGRRLPDTAEFRGHRNHV